MLPSRKQCKTSINHRSPISLLSLSCVYMRQSGLISMDLAIFIQSSSVFSDYAPHYLFFDWNPSPVCSLMHGAAKNDFLFKSERTYIYLSSLWHNRKYISAMKALPAIGSSLVPLIFLFNFSIFSDFILLYLQGAYDWDQHCIKFRIQNMKGKMLFFNLLLWLHPMFLVTSLF